MKFEGRRLFPLTYFTALSSYVRYLLELVSTVATNSIKTTEGFSYIKLRKLWHFTWGLSSHKVQVKVNNEGTFSAPRPRPRSHTIRDKESSKIPVLMYNRVLYNRSKE